MDKGDSKTEKLSESSMNSFVSEKDKVDEIEKVTKKILFLLMSFNFFSAINRESSIFVSVYLVVTKGWTPGQAGLIWFAKDVASIFSSTFVGSIIDNSKHKRLLLIIATIIVGISIISIVWTQNFTFLIAKSILEGIGQSFIVPCKSALVLGLIGRRRFDKASVSNEMADHSGSMVGIAIIGIIAYFVYPNVESSFYFFLVATLLAVLSLIYIPMSIPLTETHGTRNSIDHEAARNLVAGTKASTFSAIIKDRNILLFGLAAFSFHLCNAAVLPLMSQIMAAESEKAGLSITCVNIVVAQLTSIFAAGGMGTVVKRMGYVFPITVGFATAGIIRCTIIVALVLFAPNRYALIATQLLDGVGAGVWGLAILVMAKSLTIGTGRFSFTLGFFTTCQLVGAALSNLVSGYIVTYTSYLVGFIFLGAIGLIPVVLVPLIKVPIIEDDRDYNASINKDNASTIHTRDTLNLTKHSINLNTDEIHENECQFSGDFVDAA